MTTPNAPQGPDANAQNPDPNVRMPDPQGKPAEGQQPQTPEQNNAPKVLTREIYEWWLKEKCGVADLNDVQGSGNLLDAFFKEFVENQVPVNQERFEDFYKFAHEAQYLTKTGHQPFPDATLQQVLDEYGKAHVPAPQPAPEPEPSAAAEPQKDPAQTQADDSKGGTQDMPVASDLTGAGKQDADAVAQNPDADAQRAFPGVADSQKKPSKIIKGIKLAVIGALAFGTVLGAIDLHEKGKKGTGRVEDQLEVPKTPAPAQPATPPVETAKPPVVTGPLKGFKVVCRNYSIPENCKPADTSLYAELRHCKFDGIQYPFRPLTIPCTDAEGYPGPVYRTPYKIQERAAYSGTPYGDKVEFTVFLNEK